MVPSIPRRRSRAAMLEPRMAFRLPTNPGGRRDVPQRSTRGRVRVFRHCRPASKRRPRSANGLRNRETVLQCRCSGGDTTEMTFGPFRDRGTRPTTLHGPLTERAWQTTMQVWPRLPNDRKAVARTEYRRRCCGRMEKAFQTESRMCQILPDYDKEVTRKARRWGEAEKRHCRPRRSRAAAFSRGEVDTPPRGDGAARSSGIEKVVGAVAGHKGCFARCARMGEESTTTPGRANATFVEQIRARLSAGEGGGARGAWRRGQCRLGDRSTWRLGPSRRVAKSASRKRRQIFARMSGMLDLSRDEKAKHLLPR